MLSIQILSLTGDIQSVTAHPGNVHLTKPIFNDNSGPFDFSYRQCDLCSMVCHVSAHGAV